MLEYLDKFYQLITEFGYHLLIALAVAICGKILIKIITGFTRKILMRKSIDAAVATFVISLLTAVLWGVVIIIALSQLGVTTASFLAVLGAAGLAIGLALQGSLANFAAGFLIILFRPFKVNDLVEVNGLLGVIASINLFSTELTTVDNRRIIVPNSQIMSNTIVNITSETTRRVDFQFSVSVNNSVPEIKRLILNVIEKHELILSEPLPFVRMSSAGHSSLDFTVRVWCKTSDYWNVFFDITEQVREEFVNNQIGLPTPRIEAVGNAFIRS